MRHIFTLFLCFFAVTLFAQEPAAFTFNHLDEPAVKAVQPFDQTELMDEAKRWEEDEGRTMNGKLRYMDFDMLEAASFDVLWDGTQVWRLQFSSPGAMASCVYFDDFYIPEGASMYIYNSEKTYFEGPFGAEENNDHGRFMTNDIYGENIIVEYQQPSFVTETPSFDVMAVGYLFRYAYNPIATERAGGGSQPCEVDVNCPEIEGWEAQKDGVVRLRITDSGQQFLCSGSMVNTTAGDYRQYLLSALHCADGVSDEDLNFLQVRFNYERPDDEPCGTGGFSASRNRVGVFRLADSGNCGQGLCGADFLLLEVEDDIPDAWTPFFNGWEADGSGSSSGKGIHHPAGDIKKVSTYTNPLQSIWLTDPGAHWEVEWSPTETDHGVTEGGSSGSPIFNSNGLIVGILSAGFSACENGGAGAGTGPFESDYYGKFSHAWDEDGNADNRRLDVWLDPNNTGQTGILGSYRDGTTGVVDAEKDLDIVVVPNPSNGVFFVRTKQYHSTDRIDLLDANGRLIQSLNNVGPVEEFDIQELPAGVYFLRIEGQDKISTKQIVKI